jgi:hypothetical protein
MPFVKLSGKQIANIIVAVLIMTIVAHYEDFLPYRWQTFSAPDGSFSVAFPGKPEVNDQEVQLDAGGIAVVHVVTATPAKTTSYAFTYYEDPRFTSERVEEELNGARDGSISKVQGTISGEQHLDVDGHPARDIEARARGNSLLNVRLIAVGRRLYMLMVVDASRQRADSKNVQKFFDSLKLSK